MSNQDQNHQDQSPQVVEIESEGSMGSSIDSEERDQLLHSSPDQPVQVGSEGQSLELTQSSGVDQSGLTTQLQQSSRIDQSASPAGAQSASQSDHTPVAQHNSGFAVPSPATRGQRKRKSRKEEIDVPGIPETPNKPSFMQLSLKQIDQLVEYYIPNPVIRGPEGGIHTYFGSPHMKNILALRPGLEDACISYRARYKDIWDSVAPTPVLVNDHNRFPDSQTRADLWAQVSARPTFKWDDAAQEEVL